MAGGRPRRAPLDRKVKRTTECPCAVRLYHLTGNDIAARSEYCSVVLGAPSVGINEAVRTGLPPSSSSAEADVATSCPTSSPAVARPITVQLAWGDTTVWEIAYTALCAVRADADAAFKAERRRLARTGKSSGLNSAFHGGASAMRETTAEEDGAKAEEEDEEALEGEEALYSAAPVRYEVELLTGSVNSLGQASIIPLCVVACRQVLPGHSSLLPVRKADSVDYHTALYELAYNLGDPVFVTCTRIS